MPITYCYVPQLEFIIQEQDEMNDRYIYEPEMNQTELQNYEYLQCDYVPQMDVMFEDDYYSQSSFLEMDDFENDFKSLQ